ncbi:PIG-L deacetylase family protein [Synechococcus sp. 1G10]|uniref:PIG-L deacetylase family protein n=1 Tax=Synechococcus sp. 1G10 TaxID=2025605 RepID=UPI0013034BF1|nr:PIG-L deacetylase family protein [Synechococcus sp. 1G10]
MRVLVLSPHPDDEAIGCGGTLRHHYRAGDAVTVIHLTSGERGGHGLSPERTGPLREAEARRAAALLGVDALHFWRQRDGALRSTAALLRALQEVLTSKPVQRLYAPHGGESHPDHRATWRLAKQLIQTLELTGMAVPELWLYEVWTPLQRIDAVVDIGTDMAMKLRAIRAHHSQVEVLDFAAASRGLARYRGELLSWPEGEYAEVFQVLKP